MKKKIEVVLIDVASNKDFSWKDIKTILEEKKVVLEDDDYVEISFQEGYYSENNSWDAHYLFKVIRERLETDDEYNKRVDFEKKQEVARKQERYKNYLKLKQEFEPNEN